MMNKLKCMIVEDDPLSRKSLERLCGQNDKLELSWVCETAKKGLEILVESAPDLIFLDIEMPEMNGIEFLEEATDLKQVIFTTSKESYAYEAFQYEVTDYLKKPIAIKRFNRAIDKAFEINEVNNIYKNNAKDLYIKEDGKYVRISYSDILFFENVGDYVRIVTTKSSHIFHSTLSSIVKKLSDPRFFKVHRSFIINLDKVKDIHIQDNNLVVDTKLIPISRANKPLLIGRLNIL